MKPTTEPVSGVSVQWTLTGLYFGFFTLNIALVYSFVYLNGPSGVVRMLPRELPEALGTVVGIYAVILTTILGCWFTRPFTPSGTVAERRKRFLAILCAFLFNGALTLAVVMPYCNDGVAALEAVRRGRTLSTILSFLVVPINIAFFGTPAAQKDT